MTQLFLANEDRPRSPAVERPSIADINVRRIRLASKGIGKTQQTFASAIGVPVKTIRNWEQGRRKPTGPALVLLTLIQMDPWIVFDVLNGLQSGVSGGSETAQVSRDVKEAANLLA